MSDVPLFNDILRRHEAVISGSTALHFLMPSDTWVPNDLDIYVSDPNFPALLRDLTDPDGLHFVPFRPTVTPRVSTPEPETVGNNNASKAPLIPYNDGHPDGPGSGHDEPRSSDSSSNTSYGSDGSDSGRTSPLPPSAVTKGLRDVRTLYTPSGRRVDVIRSPSTTPITPLRFFWSTAVINFVTPDAYVCGFPHATLSRLGVLKQGPLGRRDKLAIAKYEQRGYHFLGQEWREMVDTWDYFFLVSATPSLSTSASTSRTPRQFSRSRRPPGVGCLPSARRSLDVVSVILSPSTLLLTHEPLYTALQCLLPGPCFPVQELRLFQLLN